MSLASILYQLRKEGHLKKLEIVHINHLLRGKESDKDESLVKQFAKKLRIPFQAYSVHTREYAIAQKIGIEAAARELRYGKISELASRKKINFVVTAHTANDQT